MSQPPRPTDDGLIVDGGLGSRASLRGARTRRSAGPPDPGVFASWPLAWRERLAGWLRSPAERRQIAALQRGADGPALVEITQLIDALLHAGWISVVEQHQRGGHWQARELRWIDADGLRRTLDLPVATDLAAQQQSITTRRFEGAAAALHSALLELPPARWTRRIDLVEAIARWESEGRSGTRRDLELLARGATKSISNGEWEWLVQSLDLEALRIGGHTPGLWLCARCVLRTAHGALDLAAAGEMLALTPASMQALLAIDHPPQRWVVVENRTSFERRARAATADEAVLWVPGRPPSWWLAAVGALLQLAPAPLQVACDPDPAGIAIADEVARLWQARGLPWQPLHMDPTALAALPDTRPLNDFDRQLLDALAERPLHPQLAALREALLASGRKGEQEGLL